MKKFLISKTCSVIVIAILCLLSIATAQEMVQREKTFGVPIFFETHIIANSNDSSRVEALFRLRQDLFTFTKPFETVSKQFMAHAGISVEVLDSNSNSIARDIRELTLTSEDNGAVYLRNQYLQGVMSFTLSPGSYTVLLTVEDKDAKRQIPEVHRHIQVKRPASKSLSSVIPVQLQSADGRFQCFNLAGDILFSKNCNFIFEIGSTPSNSVHFLLKKLAADEDEKQIVVQDTMAEAIVFPSSSIAFAESSDGIFIDTVRNSLRNVVIVPFNSARLKQGRYEIEFTLTDSTKLKTQFGTRWLEMPLILTDLDMAILPLQFIMTEKEYRDLRKGNRSERIHHFDEFWQKKDPTPGTAYNEMMAEFYRRADLAMSAYRSLKEPNGSITDRGKIFILYGKPTSTERILHPGSIPKEVWKYASLKKTFVFEDPSKQGNYKLTESK